MQVKYWKSFKYLLFILTFIFCFAFKINNAFAYVYKGEVWNTMDKYNVTGNLNSNSSTDITFDINNSNINSVSIPYDVVAFKFNYFYLTYETDENYTYCDEWLPHNGGYFCSSYSGPTNGHTLVTEGNFRMLATSYWGTNGDTLTCIMSSELQDYILCPIKKTTTTNLTKLELTLQNGGNKKVTYNFQLSGLKFYYNYDTSEIVNGLNGIEDNQSTTNTYIQNFNNYVSEEDTSSTETSTSSAIGGLQTEFNSHLGQMNQLTQLVFAPVNFILNMITNTCQPLVWDIPFVNTRVVVPCMSSIYGSYFSGFMSIFSTIVGGLITYRMCIKVISGIKGVLDAEDDKIEVVDL